MKHRQVLLLWSIQEDINAWLEKRNLRLTLQLPVTLSEIRAKTFWEYKTLLKN